MRPIATKHHGHNIPHIHHEVLCDYTHRLNKEYEYLPNSWVEYFKVRINNLIRKSMAWKNTYQLYYNPQTQTISITGFPTYTLKRSFKISILQTEYTLHKMDYQQALIYMYGKNYVQIDFLTQKQADDDPCVKVVYLKNENELNTDTEDYDCNILTTPTTHDDGCSCCCGKHKKQEEETEDGQSNGTGTPAGDDTDNTSTDGNNELGNYDGNNDTTTLDESILYP